MNNDSYDLDKAPVIGQSAHQPFARRSVTAVFFLIFSILVGGYFIFIWFFGSNDVETYDTKSNVIIEEQAPGNRYEEDSARGGVYNFFYKMFGGIEDGLEDNPHNLNNVEHLDDMNLDTTNLVDDGTSDNLVAVMSNISSPDIISNVPKPDDGYQHSAYDVIGSEVNSAKGVKTGTIHDILINKKTGEARGVILNEDGLYYDQDLKILKFSNVVTQDSDGDVRMLVTEKTVGNRPDFDYAAVKDTDYISLRKLRDSKILSSSNDIVGSTDAVIYENEKAQSIYFKVKPITQDQNSFSLFKLPYDAVQVVKGNNGYYIQLTEEQTQSLMK